MEVKGALGSFLLPIGDIGDKAAYSYAGEDGKSFLLENQEGYTKGYCVNYDIADDLWLMFNKVNDSDIRFNLYDSNETAFMKLATVYRYQIVR